MMESWWSGAMRLQTCSKKPKPGPTRKSHSSRDCARVNSPSIYMICGRSVERGVDKVHWGIIGFGEAGSAFAAHIGQSLGQPIPVVDPLLNRLPLLDHFRERVDRIAVEVVPNIASLVNGCDVVLSLVTPRLASQAAQE